MNYRVHKGFENPYTPNVFHTYCGTPGGVLAQGDDVVTCSACIAADPSITVNKGILVLLACEITSAADRLQAARERHVGKIPLAVLEGRLDQALHTLNVLTRASR